MSNAGVLLSHELFPEQIGELQQKFLVENIIIPPADIRLGWASVDPLDVTAVDEFLSSVLAWLRETLQEGDCCIVQGEYGATFMVVDYCLSHGIEALHSVARRRVEEVRLSGETKTSRVFRHECFRSYKRFKGEGKLC